MPLIRARLALAALLVCAVTRTAGAAASCAAEEYRENRYTVCRVDLAKADLRLFWADAAGEPYGSFRALARDLEGRGLGLPFAMNAGMYHPDFKPVGLYVEDGAEKAAISRADGPGNFHLKPNGVFYIGQGRAGVMETESYLKARPKARFATQSGPMLVVGGKIHPRFVAESDSRKIRNGVAVLGSRDVVFAIAETPVNFHAFAVFFRDRIGARDALFLDGTISSLHAPALSRSDGWFPLGPIVGVVERR